MHSSLQSHRHSESSVPTLIVHWPSSQSSLFNPNCCQPVYHMSRNFHSPNPTTINNILSTDTASDDNRKFRIFSPLLHIHQIPPVYYLCTKAAIENLLYFSIQNNRFTNSSFSQSSLSSSASCTDYRVELNIYNTIYPLQSTVFLLQPCIHHPSIHPQRALILSTNHCMRG